MTGEEKLEKVFQYINRKAEFGKTLSVGNARRAARFAYEAGRESVVENMPELDWKGLENFQYADTSFGRYTIDNLIVQILRFNGKEIPTPADCFFEDAKQAANEHYKKLIKQALWL